MANLGKYEATKETHSSSLFSYGEVPVASAKLNIWNGNIEASLEVVNRVLSRLVNRDGNAVLDLGAGTSLRVAAQPVPDMTVRILPGLAVVYPYVAGRTTTTTFPENDTIQSPVAAPRIDILYLRQDGEAGLAKGTEGVPPAVPSIPDQAIPLAQIYLRPGCTCIQETDDGENAYLSDVRTLVTVGGTHQHATDRIPPEAADGIAVSFSTAKKYRPGTLDVFVNGVLQAKDLDYTEESDARGYTFIKAPPPGAVIQHRYIIERE
jgi:hypothetical protein